MPDDKKRKLQLEYPCPWVYKIIGSDENEMRRAVAEIICDRAYKITHSRRQRNGQISLSECRAVGRERISPHGSL